MVKWDFRWFNIPVIPHKAVAEVSKIWHYRSGGLLWCMDGRANRTGGYDDEHHDDDDEDGLQHILMFFSANPADNQHRSFWGKPLIVHIFFYLAEP